jgi:hypothetical protein
MRHLVHIPDAAVDPEYALLQTGVHTVLSVPIPSYSAASTCMLITNRRGSRMMGQQTYDEPARSVIRLLLENPDISEVDIARTLEEQGITALITTVRNVRSIARLVLDEQDEAREHKKLH